MDLKVGQKVRILSSEWYAANKNKRGEVTNCGSIGFIAEMAYFCGRLVTIERINLEEGYFHIEEDNNTYMWTTGMIEKEQAPVKQKDRTPARQKTQEEVKKYFSSRKVCNATTLADIEHLLLGDGLDLPDNVVVCKGGINYDQFSYWYKSSKYPTEVSDCAEILNLEIKPWTGTPNHQISYKDDVMFALKNLIICRDAYWKIGDIYGEDTEHIHYIHHIPSYLRDLLPFQTESMAKEFARNFEHLLTKCRELLTFKAVD